MKAIGIAWPLGSFSGWGVYGLNLALELLKDDRFRPCLLTEPGTLSLDAHTDRAIAAALEEGRKFRGEHLPFPVFQGFGNDFGVVKDFRGSLTAGFFFIEDTLFSEPGLARARQTDVLVAGSTWDRDLVSSHRVPRTIVCIQGIDPALFHPEPGPRIHPDRFVVFSGGKLEYRKGQDLVIAAFKAFRQRHPDALLVFAWHNFWPQIVQEIGTSGLVIGLPEFVAPGRSDFASWLKRNGLPGDSFVDVGLVPNNRMPRVLRQANVGLFPNRCEGGTNLVAMETMACGAPCILSRNTGHLDIIGEDCLVLEQQLPCKATEAFLGVEGWGESSVEEIVAHLEWAYGRRKELAEKGARAAERMRGFCWANQVRKLVGELGL